MFEIETFLIDIKYSVFIYISKRRFHEFISLNSGFYGHNIFIIYPVTTCILQIFRLLYIFVFQKSWSYNG